MTGNSFISARYSFTINYNALLRFKVLQIYKVNNSDSNRFYFHEMHSNSEMTFKSTMKNFHREHVLIC